ncbi:hypothetical protein K0M31_002284 [Melipona bicolor]|uniref:Uncharacterized protein n=1 Tax=Melipona bicolor TaxID=60889 RepID=A0AA40GHA5_9HYME|nr:hypothetical protein K0M31_002284 [Melipona bicolor]
MSAIKGVPAHTLKKFPVSGSSFVAAWKLLRGRYEDDDDEDNKLNNRHHRHHRHHQQQQQRRGAVHRPDEVSPAKRNLLSPTLDGGADLTGIRRASTTVTINKTHCIDHTGFVSGSTSPILENGVARRPSNTFRDDPSSMPSTSRTPDGHFSGTIANTASHLTSSSPTAPPAVHQNHYREVADRFKESPTNKSARNRLQAHRDQRCRLNRLRTIENTCFNKTVRADVWNTSRKKRCSTMTTSISVTAMIITTTFTCSETRSCKQPATRSES